MKDVTAARPFRLSLLGFCSVLIITGWQLIPALPAKAQGDAADTTPKTRRDSRRESREGTNAAQPAKRAWIGIQLQDRDDQAGQGDDDKKGDADKTRDKTEQGIEVTGVYPNGPARGGVRHGDRITSINGKAVTSTKDVTEAIGALQPAGKVQIAVNRQGTEQTLNVTLGDAAAFHQPGQAGGPGNQSGNGFGPGNNYPQGYGQYPQGYGQAQDGIPEHAMMLEYNRRNSEQHQRLESQIEELIKEVKSLRKEVQDLKAK